MSSPADKADKPANESVEQTAAVSAELEHVRCMKCSYSLKGLTISGQCPECGTTTEISLEFARTLGGLASENVISGLRMHALITALSVGLFFLVLIAPMVMFGAFVLWIGFTVGTCHLADLNADPSGGKRALAFLAILVSTVLTVLSPFIVLSLQLSSTTGIIFLIMSMGNALQFYFIMVRHDALSATFAKYSLTRTPTFFPYFTAFVHGLVGLPLAVFVSIAIMFNESAAFSPGIAVIYSLPLHGIWLIWLGVRSAYCAQRLRKWSVAPQPRLPA